MVLPAGDFALSLDTYVLVPLGLVCRRSVDVLSLCITIHKVSLAVGLLAMNVFLAAADEATCISKRGVRQGDGDLTNFKSSPQLAQLCNCSTQRLYTSFQVFDVLILLCSQDCGLDRRSRRGHLKQECTLW